MATPGVLSVARRLAALGENMELAISFARELAERKEPKVKKKVRRRRKAKAEPSESAPSPASGD